MSAIATVTPNLRPGYDRKMLESMSNRSGRGWPYEQKQSQQGRRLCSKHQSCDYKSQTGLTWSYHQSRVVAPTVVRDCVSSSRTIISSTNHKLSRLAVRQIDDVSTIDTCKHAITPDLEDESTNRGTTDIDDERPIVRLLQLVACDHARLVLRSWNTGVRSLCDLKSQLKSVEQLAATDFARTIVHDHPLSRTTSAISRAISLRFSHDSNIFRSQLGRNMVVSPVWLGLKSIICVEPVWLTWY